MGFVERDKSKPQFRREEYVAARIGETDSLFKVAQVKLLAVSFKDSYEDTDGLCKCADTWTELFTLDGTYVGRLDGMAMNSHRIVKELYDSPNSSNSEYDDRTIVEKILGSH